jgi:hypothetical protein
MPQRSRGDVSGGDLSSFSFLPCEICRKHYPGACWVEHVCKICGIKGHIERRYYDNPANKKKEDVDNDEDCIVRDTDFGYLAVDVSKEGDLIA